MLRERPRLARRPPGRRHWIVRAVILEPPSCNGFHTSELVSAAKLWRIIIVVVSEQTQFTGS